MPRRETRHDIERALDQERRKRGLSLDGFERKLAAMEQQMARLRASLDPAEFARRHAQFQQSVSKIRVAIRRRRRPDAGAMPALVEPPRGPRPLQGGAAAALEFDD